MFVSEDTFGPVADNAAGIAAGLIMAAMLALLVLLGHIVNMRQVFINASPALFQALIFQQEELWAGIGLLLLQAVNARDYPLMQGVFIVTTIAVINAFETVDQIYIMTGGGPNNSTSMLLFNLWQTLFSFLDVGKASAMSVVLIAVLLIVAALALAPRRM